MESQKNKIICAVYARASTNKQGDTIENQISLLKEYIKRVAKDDEEWIIDEQYIYMDEGVSATKTVIYERPAFKRLLADARTGKFQVVLFKSLSRFARDVEEQYGAYYRLTSVNIRIIVMEDGIDSRNNDTNSKTYFGIKAVLNENQSDVISVGVTHGMKALAKRGLWSGGVTPDGYIYDKDQRKLLVDKDREWIIKEIYDLYITKQMGQVAIANYLNSKNIPRYNPKYKHWTRQAVTYILTNPVYTGKMVYNRISEKVVREYNENNVGKKRKKRIDNDESDWIVVEGTHEAIISKESFERVREIKAERSKKFNNKDKNKKPSNIKYPLGGLLQCGHCNSSIYTSNRYEYKGNIYRVCMCNGRAKKGKDTCPQKPIKAILVENTIKEMLYNKMYQLKHDEKLQERIQKTNDVTTMLQDEYKNIKSKLDKVSKDTLDLFKDRKMFSEDTYNYMLNTLKQDEYFYKEKLKEVEKRIEVREKNIISNIKINDLIDEFFNDYKENMSQEDLRIIFHKYIEKIIIKDQEIESIKYKFSF